MTPEQPRGYRSGAQNAVAARDASVCAPSRATRTDGTGSEALVTPSAHSALRAGAGGPPDSVHAGTQSLRLRVPASSRGFPVTVARGHRRGRFLQAVLV